MSILDNPDEYKKIDQSNLLKQVDELPQQLENAWGEVKKVVLPSYYTRAKAIVILGIGGSAIAGYLTKSLIERKSKIPVFVYTDYDLPEWVTKDCLVIGNSYSGNTEEPIAAFKEAILRRAKTVSITTGGEFEKLAKTNKFPVYHYDYDTQPRQALGYSWGGILGILNKVALINLTESEFKNAINVLNEIKKKIDVNVPFSQNQAKQFAETLQGKIVIAMTGGSLGSVAQRFKTQLNENSKTMAFYEILPETCHNFLIGLEHPEIIHQNAFVLILSSKYDHQRIILRRKAIIEIFSKNNILHDELQLDFAKSPLSEMFSFVYFLDYVSYYLAILNEVDPTPIKNINFLKEKLAAAPWRK